MLLSLQKNQMRRDDGFFSRLEVSERQRLREIDFVYEYKNKNTRWSKMSSHDVQSRHCSHGYVLDTNVIFNALKH